MLSRSISCCLVASALVALAGGCTVVLPGQDTITPAEVRDTGRTPSPDQRRAAFPIAHDDYAKLGYRLDWVGYPTITGNHPIRHIQPYDDIVAVLEQGGRLTILETNTGARRCGDQIGSPLVRFMGLERANERVVVATQSEVFRLDPVTCNLVGRFSTEKIVSTAPVVFGGQAIFGTGSGEILAHALGGTVDGVKTWGFATGASIEGEPVLVGSVIGAVSQNGEITFVDGQSGQLVGRNRIWGGLANNPVADDYAMYIASLDQSIYAFAADGGVRLWRHRTPYQLRGQPRLHQTNGRGVLYVPIPRQGLTALDAATGDVLWSAEGFEGEVIGIRRGRLLAFDGRTAALIDAARGDVLERVELPGVTMLKPDRFEDGSLYAVSRSGVVARFNPR